MFFAGAWMLWGGLLVLPVLAQSGTDLDTFIAGNTLLAKGDLSQALGEYAKAVRADPANDQYMQQFMLVRRAIAMEKSLRAESNTKKWAQTAQALRSFYIEQDLYPQALVIDQKIHDRLETPTSATQLAETQLALKMNAEAAEVLSALAPKESTLANRSLLGIALARQGKLDEARKLADAVVPADVTCVKTLFRAARVNAAVDNHDDSLALLTRCFESELPSRLNALKAKAKESLEFAKLASSEQFYKVLQTESKVTESKCSAGSKCATCPSRGGCSKSHAE
jgi:tetratricopeptide (TPR) repeat protein